MRFHVLGVGSIGTLVAHHLRRAIPESDKLSLIIRKGRTGFKPDDAPRSLVVEFEGIRSQVRGGFQTEYAEPQSEATFQLVQSNKHQRSRNQTQNAQQLLQKENGLEMDEKGGPIESLIVATKATRTLQAIRQCGGRITPNSTIVFLQNGMGLYESVVENLFPYAENRPNIILATTTHGAWKKRDITTSHHVVHAGNGDLHFAIVPDSRSESRDFERSFWNVSSTTPVERRILSLGDIEDDPPSARTADDPKYVSLRKTVEALLSLDLNTKWLPMAQLQIKLRQKLAINSSVNPLTALVGCRNGDLLGSAYSKGIIQSTCQEASSVFREATFQSDGSDGESLFGGGNAAAGGLQALSAGILESETFRVIKKTGANYSSMVLDMERGQALEIDYMNGYLSRMGAAYQVPTPTVDALRRAVLLKASLRRVTDLV
jgi:2-dehydropantoate 2-reductase